MRRKCSGRCNLAARLRPWVGIFGRPPRDHLHNDPDAAPEGETDPAPSPGLRWVRGRATISLVTDRAKKLLQDALDLSDDERADLAAELLATLPPSTADELHPEWIGEIERRARRALADPEGGEPWDIVEERLLSRTPR